MKRFLILAAVLFSIALPAFGQGKKRIDYTEVTTLEIGSRPTTTVTLDEQKPVIHKTIITLNSVPISMVDANNGGGTQIYTFPLGRIIVLGAMATGLQETTTTAIASTINSGVNLSVGLGTVQTTTQNSGTLATTQQDLVGQFTCVSSATINVAAAVCNGQLAASAQFDGTTTGSGPKKAFLNVGVPTATDIDADGTATFTGTITLYWIRLGPDY
jgi:hypothetical protein